VPERRIGDVARNGRRACGVLLDDVPPPPPGDGAILVRTLALGVCATDREIIAGEYGAAPPGEPRLVLGHESLGCVEEAPAQSGFAAGDLVVGIVRRPDPVPCRACAAGEWDMCLNGLYVERGIKERHGFGAERFRIEPDFAIRVDPALGITTLPQLIARAKQEPAKLTIASTGVGRLTHLTGELLQMRADISLVAVPYPRGLSAALSDVGSGRVSVIIESYTGIFGAARAGQIKLIAVASRARLPEFPDLPTVAETIPDFAASGWTVLLAPLGTPGSIVAKVSADLAKVDNDPDVKKRLAAIGSYSRAMTPEEVLAFVAKEQETWLPVLQRISNK